MAKIPKFASNVEQQKHLKQNALVAHDGARYFLPTKLKFFQYNADLADDGTFTLPAIVNSAWGVILAGNNEEHSQFWVDDDGDVSLSLNTANVVANADTDLKLCIGTAATQEPLVIKNRLGATKHINLFMFYN